MKHVAPSSPPVIALLGLGANLGDRRAALEAAVTSLSQIAGIEIIVVSRFIETEPVGRMDQPRFLNAAVKVRATISARALLDTCLAIERDHGRTREDSTRWGPRSLDIDLLLYGEHIIDEPGLCVPHPRLHERLFALQPAAEIAAGLIHPVLQRSIGRLFEDRSSACPTTSPVA